MDLFTKGTRLSSARLYASGVPAFVLIHLINFSVRCATLYAIPQARRNSHSSAMPLFAYKLCGNGLQTVNSKTDMGQLSPDEHMLMDDNKYVADVLYDVKTNKQKDLQQSRLLFKKRMFRETDETITEPQFVNLSYVQVCMCSPAAA